MTTDLDLDQRVRSILRDALDGEWGPDPVWAASPAARRVMRQERPARRRWPLRLLGVAAVIGAMGGAALLAGSQIAPKVDAGVVSNGWIALTVHDSAPSGDFDEDIWLVALDKEARRVIGTDTDGVRQLCPALSPDGRSLAYGRVEGYSTGHPADGVAEPATYQNAALVVADVHDDGQPSERIAIDVGVGLPPPCPVWSPDGAQIAFGVPRTSPINPETGAAGSEVRIVRLADRNVTVLPDLLATDLDWSPDGTQLAIASGTDAQATGSALMDGRIYLYAPATGSTRQLDSTLGAASLTWSPDSQRIAYLTGDDTHELRVIDVETSVEEVLAATFSAIHGIGPVWSPDGEAIVYQRCPAVPCAGETHEVVLVRPGDPAGDSGGPPEVVIPSFQQTDQGSGILKPYRVTWSPDSKYLLYVAWTSAWTEAGGSEPGGGIDPMVVAVPIDPAMSAVMLSQAPGLVAYDGYPDTPRVSIQTWGRRPSLD